MPHAVIGIGSNSTRLLIAHLTEGRVIPVQRMREGTRLFSGLSDGALSTESMLRTADAAARFARIARDEGCGQIHLIATSAARDAKNGEAFCDLVMSLTGLPLHIIPGREEARLSFLGAAGNGYCGMVDIGGGSTELAVSGGGRPLQAASAQLGAVRLLGEMPDLSGERFDAALGLAVARVREIWEPMAVREAPGAWYGVGGTLTCLASLDMRLPRFDREAIHGHALKKSAVLRWAKELCGMTLEERAALPGMLPQRVDIIAHGAVILLGVMEALALSRVIVSNRTNLDGYLQEIASREAADDGVQKVRAYYDASVEKEWDRLERHFFEFEINKRYIDRYVKPGDRVLDAGGGPGRYSLYMAGRGADVVLLDLSEGNVAFAREKAREAGVKLETVCADAREIGTAVEGTFDAILLMGPLYHLTEEADRARVIEACLRKLKPGGVLLAAFISMIGGMIYAARSLPESILWEGEDVFYEKILAKEDYAGPAFTHAFFIEPDHVLPFMERFPLETLHLLSSEGISAPFELSLMEQPPDVRAKWLALCLALCEREEFFSYAEHLLYIGKKKEDPS